LRRRRALPWPQSRDWSEVCKVLYCGLSCCCWSRVRQLNDDECWEWCGWRDAKGYGRLTHGPKRNLHAHRVAFQLANNVTLPHERYVLHRCDNPPCCNPSHLFEGTHLDNMLDMDAKGRARRGNPRPGEKHHGARLTDQDVLFIREARKNGVSPYKLASDFGVSYPSIYAIVKRKRWSHI